VQPSRWFSALRRRAASAALTLAAILPTAVRGTSSAQAQTFTTLTHSVATVFKAGVVLDLAGNLYGISPEGGFRGGVCGRYGCGYVFKVDASGVETVLYEFTGKADGYSPQAGLILDLAGNLYGTTSAAVFKLDKSGTFTVLHSPGSSVGLVQDAAGNLYGTTEAGGVTRGVCAPNGCGTVFKLDKSGTYTVLYDFTGSPDGAIPVAGVVLDPAGNLYGTTENGGASNLGTVFKLDTSNTESVLHSFTGAPDGATPVASVILDAAGNLYGTTLSGGLRDCFESAGTNPPSNKQIYCGVVFKVDITGTETVVHSFTGIPDGALPQASLVLDATGHFYGTTAEGGSNSFFGCEILNPAEPTGCGSIFKLDGAGTVSVVYSFSGNEDGGFPVVGLVLDGAGNLYGTATKAVFKLDPLGPPNYDLSVLPQGTGSGALAVNGMACPGSACSEFFAKGTSVTLMATAAAGSSFAGWSAPCSGTGTCKLIVNSAQLVLATFNLGAPDFSLTASALTPGTVSAGMPSSSAVNVIAAGGFSGSVALTCLVTPTPTLAPTCSISPSSTAPGTPATLTVNTSGPTAAVMSPNAGYGLLYALCLPLIGLVATRVGRGSEQKSRKGKLTATVLTCMLFTGAVFQIACSGSNSTGGGSKGTPAGTYTITVTGTYSTGSLVHTAPPTRLTVQ
jgi:uncharacterized repeat protein (TIGR03803 family)